jgi:hypothetical protein
MISVTQVDETLRQILEEEANQLAKDTGFMQRERTISGADAGPNPDLRLVRGARDQLRRHDAGGRAARRGDHRQWLAPALYAQVRLEAEAAPVALFKRFTAVIVEESSSISFPQEVVQLWRLQQLSQRRDGQKRYYLLRLPVGTRL